MGRAISATQTLSWETERLVSSDSSETSGLNGVLDSRDEWLINFTGRGILNSEIQAVEKYRTLDIDAC